MKIGLLLIIGTFGFALFQHHYSNGVTVNPVSAKNHAQPIDLATHESTPTAAASSTQESSETPIMLDLTNIKEDPQNQPREVSSSDVFDLMAGSKDLDCDGVPNREDNCRITYNPSQRDKNKNGIGDVCEGKAVNRKDIRCDTDKDGVFDRDDNCISVCNPDQKDKNKNGIGDVCDPDLLKDQVRIDPCPERKNKKRSSKPNCRKKV